MDLLVDAGVPCINPNCGAKKLGDFEYKLYDIAKHTCDSYNSVTSGVVLDFQLEKNFFKENNLLPVLKKLP